MGFTGVILVTGFLGPLCGCWVNFFWLNASPKPWKYCFFAMFRSSAKGRSPQHPWVGYEGLELDLLPYIVLVVMNFSAHLTYLAEKTLKHLPKTIIIIMIYDHYVIIIIILIYRLDLYTIHHFSSGVQPLLLSTIIIVAISTNSYYAPPELSRPWLCWPCC